MALKLAVSKSSISIAFLCSIVLLSTLFQSVQEGVAIPQYGGYGGGWGGGGWGGRGGGYGGWGGRGGGYGGWGGRGGQWGGPYGGRPALVVVG